MSSCVQGAPGECEQPAPCCNPPSLKDAKSAKDGFSWPRLRTPAPRSRSIPMQRLPDPKSPIWHLRRREGHSKIEAPASRRPQKWPSSHSRLVLRFLRHMGFSAAELRSAMVLELTRLASKPNATQTTTSLRTKADITDIPRRPKRVLLVVSACRAACDVMLQL